MSGWPGSESADFGSDDHVEWALRQQELRAARNAALEEAAKVADSHKRKATGEYSLGYSSAALGIAAAIRALKTPGT